MTDPVVCSDCGAVCIAQGCATGYALTSVPRIASNKPHVRYLHRGKNLGQPDSAESGMVAPEGAQMFLAFYDVEGDDERGDKIQRTERRICYACAAQLERETLTARGKGSLYLVRSKDAPPPVKGATMESARHWRISDWPDVLRFVGLGSVQLSTGYGFGGSYPVRTFRFVGPDGYVWSGRCAGNMDSAHVKRTRYRWLQGPNGWHAVKEK